MPRINSDTALRSMLFTPGSSEKMLSKSLTSPSDASLYDLEDSVAEDMKSKARELVGAIIKENENSNEGPPIVLVRVNDVNSEHFEKDMDEIATQGLDGIFLPKPEVEADVRKADAIITKLETQRKLEIDSIGIILQMESALGIHNCFKLCKAAKRVIGVNLGSAEDADLCRDLGAQWTPDGNTLHYSRSKVLLEARAAKMPHPTDGVYMDLKNDDGCRQDAEIARLLGYTGKAAIHPRQVPIFNEVYSPKAEVVSYYKEMLEAYFEGEKAGLGAVNFRGKMVDIAMVRHAENIINRAKAIESRI